MKGECINQSSGTIKYGTPAELFYPVYQRDFFSIVIPLGT